MPVEFSNVHVDSVPERLDHYVMVPSQTKQEFKSKDWVWRSIRDGKRHQKKRAKKLHKIAGVPRDVCGLDQVKVFQEVIPDYQLCVVSKEHLNKIIWKGPDKPKGIYLLYNDHHFDVITSMSGYLNRSYWCHPCKVAYSNKEDHRCRNTCTMCRNGNCLITDGVEAWTYCGDCNRYFKLIACYRNHKIDGSAIKKYGTICKQYYKCAKCDRVVNQKLLWKGKKHDCTDLWCRICKGNFHGKKVPLYYNYNKKQFKNNYRNGYVNGFLSLYISVILASFDLSQSAYLS